MDDLSQLPIGQRLKKSRERMGFSLEGVHEATKIPLDSLRAIEEGYTVRTLSPFYYKGFVKIYGHYLGVDVSDVIAESHQARLKKNDEPSSDYFERAREWKNVVTKDRIKQILIVIAILGCVFVVAKLVEGLMHRKPKDVTTTMVVAPENAKVVVRKPQVEKVVEQKKEVVQPEPRRAVVTETKNTPKPKKSEPKPEVKNESRVVEAKVVEPKVEQPLQAAIVPEVTPPQPAVTVTPVASTTKSGKNVVLTARARKEGWLRVKADDQVVFQSTLKVGSVETWMADEKIEISGKNLNQLEFELNGKMVGSLGRKSSKAKMLVVTKDGLNVTQ